MNCEPEDGTEHADEQNTEVDAIKEEISPSKKNNRLNEHAKPRRRRRGKKRKHRKESTATCESSNHDECENTEMHNECEQENHADQDSPSWDSTEDLSCDVGAFNDIMLRPVNVPKAPENSTQFIMDDHNECQLYMSFETPNPYLTAPSNVDESSVIFEPVGEDAAYRDIDYEYESPGDFDNSAYYDREFEMSYKNNRFDELLRLARPELIETLQTLEVRLKELNDELVKENPRSVLESLQSELLDLQEKNASLRETNTKLTALVLQVETEHSVHELSLEESSEKVSTSFKEYLISSGNRAKDVISSEEPSVCYDAASENKSICDTESNITNQVCGVNCDEIIMDSDHGKQSPVNSVLDYDRNEHVHSGSKDDQICSKLESKCDSVQRCVDSSEVRGKEKCDVSQSYSYDSHSELSCSNAMEVSDEVTIVNNKNVFHVAKQIKCSIELSLEEPSPSETSVV